VVAVVTSCGCMQALVGGSSTSNIDQRKSGNVTDEKNSSIIWNQKKFCRQEEKVLTKKTTMMIGKKKVIGKKNIYLI
jgi:hypothetical protein